VPGPLIHLGVCLVALLLYFDDRHRKYVLLLLPFAVIPDLDHFAPFYAPRLYFHNLFILAVPLAIALYARATNRGRLFDVGLLASFCLLSHLVLDFFVGDGEALLYPLATTKYGFLYRPKFLFWPEFHYETLIDEVLPKSLWSYGGLPLGIALCVVAFMGVLVLRRHFRLTTNAPEIT
jgi:hypothetical protein